MRIFAIVAVLVAAVAAVPMPEDGADVASGDICDLPPIKPGLIECQGFSERWTFNKTAGTCVRYIYGGCRGTENLFPTEVACLLKCNKKALLRETKSLPPACSQPLVVGSCKGFKKRYYYNAENGACETFNYGGCRGNENNFETLEQCQTTCEAGSQQPAVSPVTLPASVRAAPADPICSLPPIKTDGISCLAFIPSWTFNVDSGKCERYVYGGCGKTENLFPTEEACAARCVASRSAVTPRASRNACLLPLESGPCFASMKMFGFVKEKNRCEVFTYGGCKGNANRFSSADECYQTCGGDIPNTRPECEGVQCDLRLFQHYADRGCRPQYQPGACCPSRYVCPRARNQASPQCSYRGVNYAIDESVPQLTEDNACRIGCSCRADPNGGARIICAEVDCFPPPDKQGCIPLYSHNQCCPVKYECPDGDDSSEEDKKDVCVHNNKTYVEGQFMPSADPCKSCICLEGPDGKEGPVCKDVHCLIQPPEPSCSPVYVAGACCPISYACPNSNSKPIRVVKPIQEPGSVPVATLPAAVEREPTAAKNPSSVKTPLVQPVQEPGAVPVVTLPALIPGGKTGFQVNDERCLLPKEIGICRGYKPSFYYDADQQQCLRFIYGGCKGNANRFKSAEECWNVCKGEQPGISSSSGADNQPTARHGAATPSVAIAKLDVCELPTKIGPCRASVPSFSYNAETNECQLFHYGGCEGNENRFNTVEECESRCKKAAPTPRELPRKNEICSLPAEVGRCRAQKPRYYFDSAAQECRKFYYGGCGGNLNNFETAEECANACQSGSSAPVIEEVSVNLIDVALPEGSSAQPSEPSATNVEPKSLAPPENSLPESSASKPAADICSLPFKVGPCRARKTRFYFNSATQTCETFGYGGCDANENNFRSEEECLARCKPAVDSAPTRSSRKLGAVCELSADVGPCRGFDKRYFFNATAEECQEFTYGGCRGNQNNFKSLSECQEGCGSDSIQPTSLIGRARSLENPDCQLPADAGHCRGSETRYFFDANEGSCKTFIFGGCHGNANNFLSQEECSAACGRGLDQPEVPVGRARAIDATPPAPEPTDDVCSLPIAPGPCRGFQQTFGYNSEKKQCEAFVYGGCKGNGNRFPSLEACQQRCQTVEEPVLAADECLFGNVTLKVGESVEMDDPCDVCTCDTPPQVTCVRTTCPAWEPIPDAICRPIVEPGQCCPSYGCVPSTAPFIDLCADVVCPEGQRCKVSFVDGDYRTECVAQVAAESAAEYA